MSRRTQHRKQQPGDDPLDTRVRARAAVTLIDAKDGNAELEMAAFMAIFHPDHPATDEIVRGARQGSKQ